MNTLEILKDILLKEITKYEKSKWISRLKEDKHDYWKYHYRLRELQYVVAVIENMEQVHENT